MAGARGAAAGRGTPSEHDHIVDDEVVSVVVRRSPRYGRFLFLGVVVGLVVAGILTAVAAATGDPGGPLTAGASGFLRVYGALAAVCVGVGLLVFGTLAIALDRMIGRRHRAEIAERATVLTDDLTSPVSDDPPRWGDEPERRP
ncbi:hypothetical protein Q9S36_20980 [Microbacterium sp. ARD31]|uniref:hypothetical protein n=1 Tax=Microbacterium sp. ARD31 TaxID=2962576 RepID=UPI00288224F8|nr:hypothetical protein [Microbacterium sp. ARD31]MDT0182652.1 hypothetical protein [Microbacterium sp. ARD31]